MGTFVLHPKNLSDVTFNLMGSSLGSNYVVAEQSISANEAERIKIIYGEDSVAGTKKGLVPLRFTAVVFGSTQANAMSNFRTLVQAVVHYDGGTLEYKPHGLAAGVLSTFYHYVQSRPPQMIPGSLNEVDMGKFTQAGIAAGSYGLRCAVELMTKPWATSDIDSPDTITSLTTLDNVDDSNDDNHIVISSSSIKGDCVVPIIEVKEVSTSRGIKDLYVHKRKMRVSANTNLDFLSSEDSDFSYFASGGSGWSSQSDSNVCDGNFRRLANPGQGEYGRARYLFPAANGFDKTYFGKIAIIACLKVGSSTSADVYAQAGLQRSNTKTITDTDWGIYIFEDSDFPDFPIPDKISNSDIDDYISNYDIFLWIDEYSGTGGFDFDFLWIPKADDWIAKVSSYNLLGSDTLVIDAFDKAAFESTLVSSVYAPEYSASVYGSSLSDLAFEKGFDHRVRFLSVDDLGAYTHQDTFSVKITGIYHTIYPFSET